MADLADAVSIIFATHQQRDKWSCTCGWRTGRPHTWHLAARAAAADQVTDTEGADR